jgi:hypothetical protein
MAVSCWSSQDAVCNMLACLPQDAHNLSHTTTHQLQVQEHTTSTLL